jgi:NAD(P)-dependent dehydrogenase (short-subunit alcohol dehydrogenase family)
MNRSYVVTGGGHGIGRALVGRLLADDGSVVAIELPGVGVAVPDRAGCATGATNKQVATDLGVSLPTVGKCGRGLWPPAGRAGR